MEYLNLVALIAAGLVLIIKGADFFVDAASALARALGVPPIIIGATVVSIGTTLPEFISSTVAAVMGGAAETPEAAQGFFELSVSNAAGSMLSNTAIVLALVMLIKPPKTEGAGFASKGIFLIAVAVLLAVFAVTGATLELYEGIILLILFIAFMSMNVIEAVRERKGNISPPANAVPPLSLRGNFGNQPSTLGGILENPPSNPPLAKGEGHASGGGYVSVLKFVVGAGMIALGAILLVSNSQTLCDMLGVPEQIVGLTVVGIGTSMPELVTSMTALKKGNSDIGVGNIIGANIINATLILGTATVIAGGAGLPIDWVTRSVAVWLNAGIMTVLVVPSILTKKAGRVQGGIMLASYIGFMIFNIVYVAQS